MRVAVERAHEDAALREERRAADASLRSERDERAEKLAALLRFEREQTDQSLHVERDRADAAVATRDDFLGMVSHDLRTLLAGIAFDVALLLQDVPEGDHGRKTVRLGQHIQRYVARMNRLVGDLLDVVSIEAGKLHVEPAHHDAVRLLRETVEAFQPTAAAKGIALTAAVAKGSLLAEFDHERVLQVLANLVSNALKFTATGGTIAIEVAPYDGRVRFAVVDTGVGIPAARLGAVFERFWQSDPMARQGLGLGLFISRYIVEAHGGRIWVESEPGKGSAFYFTLPAAPAAAAET
jgi:signal transduction histidine kinase